jgi:glycosyltransferase involved in cell wall biosynthesis
MKKRICFYSGAMNVGGIGRTINVISNELIKNGHKVDLVLSKAEGDFIAFVPEMVKIHSANRTNKGSLFFLIRYILKYNPDVVISYRPGQNIINLLAKIISRTETKTVIFFQTHISNEHEYNSSFKIWFHKPLLKLLQKNADYIVAVSEGVAVDISNYFSISNQNIIIINNPVDIENSRKQLEKKKEFHWYKKIENENYFISVGRLVKQKDYPTLIKAFRKYRDKKHGKLVILGEGDDRVYLENLIIELDLVDDVLLPGYIDNPFPYVANASLFIMSSLWEGFGNVLIEALAVGTPVLSTNCPSGPSEIINHNDYGILVEPDNVDRLAEEMIKFNPNNYDSKKLKNRAEEYSSYNITRIYEEKLNLR